MWPPNLLFPMLLHLTSIGAESHVWYVYMSWQYSFCHNTPRCFLFHGQHFTGSLLSLYTQIPSLTLQAPYPPISYLLRIAQWKNTSTLWLHGFWSYDWADNYVKVDMVNTTGMSFVINSSTPPVYGELKSALYAFLLCVRVCVSGRENEMEYYVYNSLQHFMLNVLIFPFQISNPLPDTMHLIFWKN